MTDPQGPKISSRLMRMELSVPRKSAGSEKTAFADFQAITANDLTRLQFAPIQRMAGWSSVVSSQRPDQSDPLGECIPDFQLAQRLSHLIDELIVDACFDYEPRRRSAALASGVERAVDACGNSDSQVGVVEDDHRVFAAHLKLHLFQHFAADFSDMVAGSIPTR